MTDVMTSDVLIIGAGPAGLAAAKEVAAAGLTVTVVDENASPGGQIQRQRLPLSSSGDEPASLLKRDGSVKILTSTVCLGFRDGKDETILASGEQILAVRSRALILATGALERVVPIPGWTLPSVMTAGAAQTMLKGSGTFPFGRVTVAGSGPLLLAAAAQLVRAGVDVTAVVEAIRPRPSHLLQAPRLLRGGPILTEGLRYAATLARARVPVLSGRGVRRVVGTDTVEGVEVGWLAPDWSFRRDREHTQAIACDAVVLSHGFTSAVDLAALLSVRLLWDGGQHAWRPWRDHTFETSEPSVWAIGDCAGVAGAQVSTLEGTLAGLAVVQRLANHPLPVRRVRGLRRRLNRLLGFQQALQDISHLSPGAWTWATPDTVVCRCQGTTAGEVEAAISDGAVSPRALKLRTRAGMGRCQGRTCAPLLQGLLNHHAPGGPLAAPSTRFPARPVSAGALARWTVDSDGAHESELFCEQEQV